MLSISRSHKRTLYFGVPEPTAKPPAGYAVFEALAWGQEPIATECDCDIRKYPGLTSNFQVVGVWVAETRQFTAVGNYSIFDRAQGDMDALYRLNLRRAPDLLKLYEAKGLAAVRDLKFPDGFSLQQKFAALVFDGKFTSAMWTDGAGNWADAPQYRSGTMVYGKMQFAATVETEMVTVRYPGTGEVKMVACRRILPFRRADFAKDPDQYPWLFNWHTAARITANDPNFYYLPAGGVRVPMPVLDPRDFPFTGGIAPAGFYIPAHWCRAV